MFCFVFASVLHPQNEETSMLTVDQEYRRKEMLRKNPRCLSGREGRVATRKKTTLKDGLKIVCSSLVSLMKPHSDVTSDHAVI